MKNKLYKSFAIFTAFCIALYTPAALTDWGRAGAEETQNFSEDVSGSVAYFDPVSGQTLYRSDAVVFSADVDSISTGWYVLDKTVGNVTKRVEIKGDVNIIVADDANCLFQNGIRVESGNSLTFWGQSADFEENGTLAAIATNGDNSCIGSNCVNDGNPISDSGLITINGGKILANCSTFTGAGIGGGRHSNGHVVINGGVVSASGGRLGAGIGGGFQAAGDVTVTGGSIIAQSGSEGAAIGGGCEGAGEVKISGGSVNAKGTARASAIGGGLRNKGDVTITGGEVWAEGGDGKSGSIGDGPVGEGDNKTMVDSGGVFSTGENGSPIVHGDIGNTSNKDEWHGIVDDTVYGDVVLDRDYTVENSLSFSEGSSLTVSEGVTLTNNGDIRCDGGKFENRGTVENNGEFYGGDVVENSGTFNNYGDLEYSGEFKNSGEVNNENSIFGTGEFTNEPDGKVKNNGDFYNQNIFENNGGLVNSERGTVSNVGELNNDGNIENSGELVNSGELTNNGEFKNAENGQVENNGVLHNSADGVIENNGGLVNSERGTVSNVGEFSNGGNIENSGEIVNSGELTNNGEFKNTSESRFENSGSVENNNEFINDEGADYSNSGTVTNKSYTVTFVSGYGAELPAESVEYGSLVPAPNAERTGYTLVGWYIDEYFSEEWDFDGSTMPARDITLYAKWQINSYTITFVSDENVMLPEKITAEYGTTIKLPEVPELIGHTGKWIVDGKEVSELKISGNVTVKAVYSANSYTITFVSDENVTLPEKITAEYGTTIKLPEVPELIGHTGKWVVDGKEVSELTISENVTVKAVYTANIYTVTFVSDENVTLPEKITAEYGTTVKLPEVPELIGHTGKWIVDGKEVSELKISENVTVKAVYTANSYTITFVSDENVTLPEKITAEYGTTIKLPEVPELIGHTGKWIVDGKEVSEITISENVTVKAVYTANIYTVTFVSDENVTLPEKITAEYGTTIKLPEVPELIGHTGKWVVDGKEVSELKISGNVTVKAVYTANIYTVTFVSDENVTLPEKITAEYGTTIKLPEVPELIGHTGKWIVDGKEVSEITISGNVTVKSVYAVNSYKALFKNDGETVCDAAANYGDKLTPPEKPTKDGYRFAGWYLDEELSAEWDFESGTMPAHDITLFAGWIKLGGVSEKVETDRLINARSDMSPDEIADAVLTDEDRKLLDEGKNIEIVLGVDETEISEGIRLALNGISGFAPYKCYDIELLKIIEEQRESVHLTQTPIRIIIDLPENSGGDFRILRIHNGEAEILDDLDDSDKTYTFESDKFSAYVLGFAETPSDSPTSGASDSESLPSESSPEENIPTGANSSALLGIICLAGTAAAAAVMKKKK